MVLLVEQYIARGHRGSARGSAGGSARGHRGSALLCDGYGTHPTACFLCCCENAFPDIRLRNNADTGTKKKRRKRPLHITLREEEAVLVSKSGHGISSTSHTQFVAVTVTSSQC